MLIFRGLHVHLSKILRDFSSKLLKTLKGFSLTQKYEKNCIKIIVKR